MSQTSTVRTTVQIPRPSISIQHHAWYTWAEIAIEQECLARRAHDAKDVYEYRPGLVALTSAAFALDALAGVARALGIDASAKRRGGAVAERLKRGVVPQRVSAECPRRIVQLFNERKDAVHFEEASEAPVWPEKLESNVDPNVLRWGASGARVAVDLMLEVLAGWADHPSGEVAEWAGRHRDSVRTLETIRDLCTGRQSADQAGSVLCRRVSTVSRDTSEPSGSIEKIWLVFPGVPNRA